MSEDGGMTGGNGGVNWAKVRMQIQSALSTGIDGHNVAITDLRPVFGSANGSGHFFATISVADNDGKNPTEDTKWPYAAQLGETVRNILAGVFPEDNGITLRCLPGECAYRKVLGGHHHETYIEVSPADTRPWMNYKPPCR